MSSSLARSSARNALVGLTALVLVGSLSGCALYGYSSLSEQEYGSVDMQEWEELEVESAALTSTYMGDLQVKVVSPTGAAPGQGFTTKRAYTVNSTDEVFVARGLMKSGDLVGITVKESPSPGQSGPLAGTLGILSNQVPVPVALPNSLDIPDGPYTVGQVSTSNDAIAWTQAPTGTDQWSVLYQEPTTTAQLISPPQTTHTVLDGTLGLASAPRGNSLIWGTQAVDPQEQIQFRSFIHQFGNDPDDMVLTSSNPINTILTGEESVTAMTFDDRSVLNLEGSFWLQGDLGYGTVKYRKGEQIVAFDASPNFATALVTSDGTSTSTGPDAGARWIDVFSFENIIEVARIPVPDSASSVAVCGTKVAWLATTDEGGPQVYLHDGLSADTVTLPQGVGDVDSFLCSNTALAVTLFDSDKNYVGVDITTW